MTDERAHGKWTGTAQASAAVIGALVALAGLVIGFWRSPEQPKPVAAPAPTAAATPKRAGSPISVDPARAALSWAGPADATSGRTLTAVVTVRITNNGELPVAIAWLDARTGAVFDLDDGTHLAAGRDAVFSGFPDCAHDKPRSCDRGNATRLDPGESQEATISLAVQTGSDQQKRVARAARGSLTARLVVIPGMDEHAAYARSVSLSLPLVNGAR